MQDLKASRITKLEQLDYLYSYKTKSGCSSNDQPQVVKKPQLVKTCFCFLSPTLLQKRRVDKLLYLLLHLLSIWQTTNIF